MNLHSNNPHQFLTTTIYYLGSLGKREIMDEQSELSIFIVLERLGHHSWRSMGHA
jgi:hypothetical protein